MQKVFKDMLVKAIETELETRNITFFVGGSTSLGYSTSKSDIDMFLMNTKGISEFLSYIGAERSCDNYGFLENLFELRIDDLSVHFILIDETVFIIERENNLIVKQFLDNNEAVRSFIKELLNRAFKDSNGKKTISFTGCDTFHMLLKVSGNESRILKVK